MTQYSKYYKLIAADKTHYGFTYQDGLNVDTVPFNPTGQCQKGGLYFTTASHIFDHIRMRGFDKVVYLCDVTLPDDARVYHETEKSKADRIILSNWRDLSDIGTWIQMRMEEEALWFSESLTNITMNYIAGYNWLSVLKFLYREHPKRLKCSYQSVVLTSARGHDACFMFLYEKLQFTEDMICVSLHNTIQYGYVNLVFFLIHNHKDIVTRNINALLHQAHVYRHNVPGDDPDTIIHRLANHRKITI